MIPNFGGSPSHAYYCETNPCGIATPSCSCAGNWCSGIYRCGEGAGTLTCTFQAVCASPDTPIATPAGERPIAAIGVGDLVYSVDANTTRVVRVLRASKRRAIHHHVIRATLSNGRVLEISAPHPTADGRTFGDLLAGDSLDGERIATVQIVDYAHEYTYDILPDSDTGYYFVAGVLVGSTLEPEFTCCGIASSRCR
jgi:hypothetical protein